MSEEELQAMARATSCLDAGRELDEDTTIQEEGAILSRMINECGALASHYPEDHPRRSALHDAIRALARVPGVFDAYQKKMGSV